MGSKLLPQVLVSFPPTAASHTTKSGFSYFSSLSTSFSSSQFMVSKVSHNGGSTLAPIIMQQNSRSFIMRSELNSEGETAAEDSENVGEAEENTEESAELEAEASVAVEEKPPRKPRIKLGDIMGILNKQAIEAAEKERTVPDIRTGDVVEIKLEVPENRRRASIYKGIVISKQNAGIHTTIRIRRIIAGTGVEIVFPLYSPNIKEIKVVSHRKVRRARLYYLRDKLPRLSTFK